MSNTMFGVSLICYNEEKTLPKCLDSIFQQTIKPSSVVIIDDMSTDRTPEIIEEYKRRYPEIASYRTYVKKGIKGINISYSIHLSLIKLLEEKELEYIVRMDSDAILINPETFRLLTSILKNNPKIGITGAYYGKAFEQHICDAVRIYTRECIVDIMENNHLQNQRGFYPIMFGHDSFTIWRAKYLGYFVKPSKVEYYDVRPYRRGFLQWYQTAWLRYMNGFSLMHQVVFTIRHIKEKPFFIGSLISFFTFFLCFLLPRDRFEVKYTDYIYNEYNRIVINSLLNRISSSRL